MTTVTTTPAVTTRIAYNRETVDFDCFATVDGLEIYLGSRPNFFDGEALCRQYRYDAAVDSYCPEQAAAIAMEPDEAPVDDGPEDNWGGFRCPCGTAAPAYASERAAAVARRLVYCERCGKAGTTTDEDADWYCPDCTAASVKCACGAPATITVRTRDSLHFLCSPCFERDFQCNEARTDAWEVLARVPGLATYPCETCGIPKPIAGFTQLRADDKHAICDDCRVKAAVRHSGASSTVSDYRCEALYELALTDLTGLRELLADRSLYQRERLAWEFSSWLLRKHGIVCEPTKIVRSWDELYTNEPQRAA